MSPKVKLLGIVGAVWVCGSSAAHAVVISNFEGTGTYYGGTEGWFNYGGNASYGIVSNPTGGTGGWLQLKPQQYSGGITAQNWAIPNVTNADFNSNTDLEFDIIVGNDWLPSNFGINVEMQVFGGTAGNVNKNLAYSNSNITKNTVIHVDLPYATVLPALDPTATGYNLTLGAYPGYDWGWDTNNPDHVAFSPTWYLDNVQLTTPDTPEPAALATLALGGLIALRRRRA